MMVAFNILAYGILILKGPKFLKLAHQERDLKTPVGGELAVKWA
jgi:hypothetical protein